MQSEQLLINKIKKAFGLDRFRMDAVDLNNVQALSDLITLLKRDKRNTRPVIGCFLSYILSGESRSVFLVNQKNIQALIDNDPDVEPFRLRANSSEPYKGFIKFLDEEQRVVRFYKPNNQNKPMAVEILDPYLLQFCEPVSEAEKKEILDHIGYKDSRDHILQFDEQEFEKWMQATDDAYEEWIHSLSYSEVQSLSLSAIQDDRRSVVQEYSDSDIQSFSSSVIQGKTAHEPAQENNSVISGDSVKRYPNRARRSRRRSIPLPEQE